MEHGGSLEQARARFPNAPLPLIDLSTGINPHSYPLFDLPATALRRLPEPARIEALCDAAARAYGAPSGDNVAASPGTQMLLPRIAELVKPGRALVLGPTYQEHAHAAALAGHTVEQVSNFGALGSADLAIVVNPNNPDGRVVSRAELLGLATRLANRGGMLVVDEAFMDVGPRHESVAGDVTAANLVVLRSFGKFYGLAGVRLGFALASKEIVTQLRSELGPWAVSGPALDYGLRALADTGWQEMMRQRLAGEAQRLTDLFMRFGIATGGTSLYRHIRLAGAASLYQALGESGVMLRAFTERPDELRCGLPGEEPEWQRLEQALGDWARSRPSPNVRSIG